MLSSFECGSNLGRKRDFGELSVLRAAKSAPVSNTRQRGAVRELQDATPLPCRDDPCGERHGVRKPGEPVEAAGAGRFLGGMVRPMQNGRAGIGKSRRAGGRQDFGGESEYGGPSANGRAIQYRIHSDHDADARRAGGESNIRSAPRAGYFGVRGAECMSTAFKSTPQVVRR